MNYNVHVYDKKLCFSYVVKGNVGLRDVLRAYPNLTYALVKHDIILKRLVGNYEEGTTHTSRMARMDRPA